MTGGKKGNRFSLNYLVPTEMLVDSVRMRRRIGILIYSHFRNIVRTLNAELGLGLSTFGSSTDEYWPTTFAQMELHDVFDAITIALRKSNDRAPIIAEIQRIFDEEHVGYTIDELGGVHFKVDAEFQRVRASAISVLSSGRYDGVRDQFERAYKALDSIPPDGKSALRAAFNSVEALFRLMFSDAHQLSASEVTKHLKPTIDRLFRDQRPALQAIIKQAEAFKDWIDSAHFYRHEPGTEEPSQPPRSLSILMVSQAAAYLRWLQQFDKI